MVYLDNNSTTILCDSAYDAMYDLAKTMPFNPSSVHSFGRKAKYVLEEARKTVLDNFNASERYDLVFTSSGSESNNLVLKNFYNEKIFISAIEHLSVYQHTKYHQNIGVIRVDREGLVDLQHLESLLQNSVGNKVLVSIIYANNETGVLQDFEQIIPIVKKYGALIHSDFSQAPGKLECDLDKYDLDFVTISAHKFGGPVGVAGLFYNKAHHLIPEIIGGGQERGVRSGTENVIGAVGMAAAVSQVNKDLPGAINYVKMLRDTLESKIKDFYGKVKIASYNTDRLCNTSMIMMPNVESQLQIIQFDMNGFAVSAGSACSSGKIGLSHVLSAMKYDEQDAACAIRISLNKNNTINDVSSFVELWQAIFEKHNKLSTSYE
jgi:cysteine desulfurase